MAAEKCRGSALRKARAGWKGYDPTFSPFSRTTFIDSNRRGNLCIYAGEERRTSVKKVVLRLTRRSLSERADALMRVPSSRLISK
jgi:hypothetical protein